MNKLFIKYPDTKQYRDIIHTLKRKYTYKGQNDNNEPVYENVVLPTIKFRGTVKLHGTNAAVCYNDKSSLYCQSRGNVITPIKDNAGFASFVLTKQSEFMLLIDTIKNTLNIDTSINTIAVYGEWAGKGVQNFHNLGVNKLDKKFYLFGIRISSIDFELTESGIQKREVDYWIEDISGFKSEDECIKNITEFPTYEIDIDFNNTESVRNKLETITNAVEEHCPVAKAYGFEGVGEGVVWVTFIDNERYTFKIKGEKHATSSTKKVVNENIEEIANINEFVEYAVTENRINQGIKEYFENISSFTKDKTKEVLYWIFEDIIKEESDVIKENNIDFNKSKKFISKKVMEYLTNLPA